MEPMKKSKIIRRLTQCIDPRQLCRVYMKYSDGYFYYFPLKVNDKFFLGAVEDDFQLDGYCIRRIKQVQKAQIRDDKCLEIEIAEGLVKDIAVPKVSLSDWPQMFRSLRAMNRNIIIEHESRDRKKCEFYIGRIEEVKKHSVIFRHFDADGVWQEETVKIPYSHITSVTFGARYVDVFSKYLPKI